MEPGGLPGGLPAAQNKPLPTERTTVLLRHGPNHSCLHCKHVACESRSCARCASQKREETVGGRTRNGVHEGRLLARLRQSSLAAVAHAHGQETANAAEVHCLKERAPLVGLTLVVGGARQRLKLLKTPFVPPHEIFSASELGAHSDAEGNAELGLVETQAQQNITQHCHCKRVDGMRVKCDASSCVRIVPAGGKGQKKKVKSKKNNWWVQLGSWMVSETKR